jgi:hypothetical protein
MLQTPGEQIMRISDATAKRVLQGLHQLKAAHGAGSWQVMATLQQIGDRLPGMNIHQGEIPLKQEAQDRHLKRDESYQHAAHAYIPPGHPIWQNGLRDEIWVAHAGADGNCMDRSTMLSLTCQEGGYMGLRLRNAICFAKYHRKFMVIDRESSATAAEMDQIMTPSKWQSETSALVTATVLERPVILLGGRMDQHCALCLPSETARSGSDTTATQAVIKLWCAYRSRNPSLEHYNHFVAGFAKDHYEINRVISKLPVRQINEEASTSSYSPGQWQQASQWADIIMAAAQDGRDTSVTSRNHVATEPPARGDRRGTGKGQPANGDKRGEGNAERPNALHQPMHALAQPQSVAGDARKTAPGKGERKTKPNTSKLQDNKIAKTMAKRKRKDGLTKKQTDAMTHMLSGFLGNPQKPSKRDETGPKEGMHSNDKASVTRSNKTAIKKAEAARRKQARMAEQAKKYRIEQRQAELMRTVFTKQAATTEPNPTNPPQRYTTAARGHNRELVDRRTNEPQTFGAKANRRPDTKAEELTIATINIRGHGSRAIADLNTLQPGYEGSVLTALIVYLIDTQLANKQQRHHRFRKALSKYSLYHSSSNDGGQGQGVTIGVPRHWRDLGIITVNPLAGELRGYALHLTIRQEGQPAFHLVGVYLPPSLDSPQRRRIYELLRAHILRPVEDKDEAVIIGGDWNAVLEKSDRSSGTLTGSDTYHQRFYMANKLHRIAGERRHTYHGGSGSSHNASSRIDDILYRPRKKTTATGWHHKERVIEAEGCDFDHHPLEATLNTARLGITMPPPPLPSTPKTVTKLKLPIPKEAAEETRARIEHDLAFPIAILEDQLSQYRRADVQEHMEALKGQDAATPHQLTTLGGQPARSVVENLAERVIDLLTRTQELALEICPTETHTRGGEHMRPRKVAKQRAAVINERRLLGELARAKTQEDADADQLVHIAQTWATHEKNVERRQAPQSIIDLAANTTLSAEEWAETIQQEREQRTKKQKAIDREHMKIADQKEINRRRAELDKNQRLASKSIFGERDDAKPKGGLIAVQDSTGRTTTNPEEVIAVVEEYFTDKQSAPTGVKDGKYLPGDAERNYPFSDPKAPDPYVLETLATSGPRHFLHQKMEDRIMFLACINSLSSGKAPGPDEIVNEVLKILPHRVKALIHDLFIIMWATGITPDTWKTSHTVLIYKDKGSPTDLKYYRPIALANTLYKLWTRTVTCVLYDFAEKHRVLSRMQAGFRSMHRTTDQLQLVVQAIQDAMLNCQDIYTILVDFSSAFNTPG